MITVRALSASLGQASILHDISFSALPGCVTAIAGPSGSGKTTLLKALSGEISHRGEITLNGRPLKSLSARAQAALRGVLPQSSTLAFPFAVSEVVALGLTAGGTLLRGDHVGLISRALEQVGLGGFSERSYLELSGGEQQRVQLARVLCQISEPVVDEQPRWLYLDEPVSSLDIHHQLTIMQLAKDFAQRGGGVIAVMHDLNLTALFADRLIFMKAGRLVAEGLLAEVMTDRLLQQVFNCGLKVNRVPANDVPFVLPHTASA